MELTARIDLELTNKPTEEVTEESNSGFKTLRNKIEEYRQEQAKLHGEVQSYLSPLVRGYKIGRHPGTGGIDKSLSFNKRIRRGKNKKARISRRINRQQLKRAS